MFRLFFGIHSDGGMSNSKAALVMTKHDDYNVVIGERNRIMLGIHNVH